MNLYYSIGIVIIVICTLGGWKKGFVRVLGSICASILSFSVLWVLRAWVFESFLANLMFARDVIVIRVVIGLAVYLVLFALLNAIIMSLKFITKLPVIRGINKILGLVAGFVHGLILVGIMTLIYEWITHIG